MECKIQWLQQDHPSINHSKWNAAELERLYKLVDAQESKDWYSIASDLAVRPSSLPPIFFRL